MSEEVKIKISQPMFEVGELERFDNNIHSIVEEYSKMKLHEKDQILTQRIIIKQEEEIEKLQNQLQQKENIIKGLDNTIENLEKVVEHKENIIKEVREYIEKHKHLNWYNDSCYMNDLLEILDKVD